MYTNIQSHVWVSYDRISIGLAIYASEPVFLILSPAFLGTYNRVAEKCQEFQFWKDYLKSIQSYLFVYITSTTFTAELYFFPILFFYCFLRVHIYIVVGQQGKIISIFAGFLFKRLFESSSFALL